MDECFLVFITIVNILLSMKMIFKVEGPHFFLKIETKMNEEEDEESTTTIDLTSSISSSSDNNSTKQQHQQPPSSPAFDLSSNQHDEEEEIEIEILPAQFSFKGVFKLIN